MLYRLYQKLQCCSCGEKKCCLIYPPLICKGKSMKQFVSFSSFLSAFFPSIRLISQWTLCDSFQLSSLHLIPQKSVANQRRSHSLSFYLNKINRILYLCRVRNHAGDCRKLFNIFVGANSSARGFGKRDSREVR